MNNRRPFQSPGNLRTLIVMARVMKKMIVARIQDRLGVIRDHWFIVYVRGVQTCISAANRDSMIAVSAPKGKFWADPMVVKRGWNELCLYGGIRLPLQPGPDRRGRN